MHDHDGIDSGEQVRVHMTNVIADSAAMQRHGVHPPLRHSHDLADEQIVLGDVLNPIIIAIKAKPHHTQHEDVPKTHPRPAGMGWIVSHHFFFQQIEDRLIDSRRAENPLQSGEDGRQFVTAFERNHDQLDGRLPQVGLSFESLAHLAGPCTNVAL